MNNLPKQFQNKVDDLAVDLIGEDHVTVRNGLIEFAQEYAKYRLEEFIADHFPEDSPKNNTSNNLTEKDCKELDDCLNDMFRKAYKTGINIPKEDDAHVKAMMKLGSVIDSYLEFKNKHGLK